MLWSVHDVDHTQRGALLALFESASDYFRLTSGRPPSDRDADETLTVRPPMVRASEKHSIGLWDGAHLVAFADVLHGYPSSEYAFIGLLLVRGSHRGAGLGRELHDAVLERATGWRGVQRMRLGVVDTNADRAASFWRRLGYEPTGEEKSYSNGDIVSRTSMWERGLP